MRRLRHGRPSPALVIAVLALVAALAGTAVAEVATTAKLDKKEKKQAKKIAKKQANKQIDKRAPGLSVAEAETARNADQLGGVAADQYQQRLFAVVRENGDLVRGANATGAEQAVAFIYDVAFNRDVRECAFNATIGRPDDTLSETGFATVNRDPTDANGVRVATYSGTGVGAPRPFHLEVAC